MVSSKRKQFQSDVSPHFHKLFAKDPCWNCGRKKAKFEVHHIVPLAIGGTNSVRNLCWLCEKCHDKIHKAMHL